MANLQLVFNGILSVGVIGALVFTGLAFRTANETRKPLTTPATFSAFNNRDGGDSPVRVLGGSITLRSKAAWNCSGPCTTTLSNVPSEISFLGTAGTSVPTGWTSIAIPWEIDVFGRIQSGMAASANGIQICSNLKADGTGCDFSAGSLVNSVAIKALSGSSALFVVPSDNVDFGVRFHDTSCDSNSPAQECEYIGQIKMIIGGQTYTYTCPAGECGIGISPHP